MKHLLFLLAISVTVCTGCAHDHDHNHETEDPHGHVAGESHDPHAGEAAEKLRTMIKWQGGSPEAVDHPLKYFKNSKLKLILYAPSNGYIKHIDAKTAGKAAVLLGAGRNTMEDEIDYGAGIWLDKKAGEAVKKGEPIATLYSSDKKRLQDGADLLKQAFKISKKKPAPYKIIEEIIK